MFIHAVSAIGMGDFPHTEKKCVSLHLQCPRKAWGIKKNKLFTCKLFIYQQTVLSTFKKKYLVLFLVSAALLTVSCKKDDVVKLTGTNWKATMSVMNFNGEYTMAFVTDSTGHLDMKIVEGGFEDIETTVFAYTFDGKTGGSITPEGEVTMPFTYVDTDGRPVIRLSFDAELAHEMGISSLDFYKL